MERRGKLYPIKSKCKTDLSRGDLSELKASRETYSKKEIMPGLVIYAGSEPFKLDEAIPWNLI